MCALTPFPTPKWPLVNPIGYEHNYICESSGRLEIPLDSQSPAFFTQTSNFDPCMVKKLNHNASERDRRKKVNSMYSSLRSLLPVADQTKKLSFPATVSHALKYIPELQEQVERLVRKKQELMLRLSEQGRVKRREEQQRNKSRPKGRCLNASVSVSTNRVSESEVSVQISTRKIDDRIHLSLSEILHFLGQRGFLVLNAASSESFGGMVFYSIHLQMELETACKVGSEEALSEKICALIN
ncbi:basic helix-loop-helix 38, OBP3-RESPONSIVE GENE 3 [Hibiscus trionum]|uniref:Basic helix-loop-helix 38, OBP3-RESPONSIVE GENE 3 n=1 Tax=Hibiscus trionum TaxID=183268 RepID=A0A9W7HQF3_HIBTR|nr:basic helix-loop-helix 38, OBP3-RESPONSIVE GENE 3 [Hibiscus trionum]